MNTTKKPSEKQMIHAFQSYMDAHNKLSELWRCYDNEAFSMLYPFSDSFDDLEGDVTIWCKDAIFQLKNRIELQMD